MKKYVTPETKYYKINTEDLMQFIVASVGGDDWHDADAKRYNETNEDNFINYKFSIWED